MSQGIADMNTPLTLSRAVRDNSAFNDGEFATMRKQGGLHSLGLSASGCLQQLNEIAISQMRSLPADHNLKRLAP